MLRCEFQYSVPGMLKVAAPGGPNSRMFFLVGRLAEMITSLSESNRNTNQPSGSGSYITLSILLYVEQSLYRLYLVAACAVNGLRNPLVCWSQHRDMHQTMI